MHMDVNERRSRKHRKFTVLSSFHKLISISCFPSLRLRKSLISLCILVRLTSSFLAIVLSSMSIVAAFIPHLVRKMKFLSGLCNLPRDIPNLWSTLLTRSLFPNHPSSSGRAMGVQCLVSMVINSAMWGLWSSRSKRIVERNEQDA